MKCFTSNTIKQCTRTATQGKLHHICGAWKFTSAKWIENNCWNCINPTSNLLVMYFICMDRINLWFHASSPRLIYETICVRSGNHILSEFITRTHVPRIKHDKSWNFWINKKSNSYVDRFKLEINRTGQIVQIIRQVTQSLLTRCFMTKLWAETWTVVRRYWF